MKLREIAFLVVVGSAIVAGFVLGWCGCAAPARPIARPTATVIYVDEAEQVRVGLESAWLSTAFLDVEDSDDGGGIGSGALVDVKDVVALVLTADHVVRRDAAITALWVSFPNGKKFLGRVWWQDWRRDLALVEVLGHVGLPPIKVAAVPPRRLARVWNMGAPDGQWGHVGAGRWGRLWDARGRYCALLRMVTGGFFWDGMSGGPVVDEHGALVGISDTVHQADAVDAGDDDPVVRVPEMGGAVDWSDMRNFLHENGVK